MKGIFYKNNHQTSEEVIIYILKQLGCQNIINNDYNNKEEDYTIKSFNGKFPDFLCDFEGKPTAVEVGVLSQGYNDKNNKIHELLKIFNYVIHLFADNRCFLLHCVVYTRKMLVSGDVLDKLKKQAVFCTSLIDELQESEEYKDFKLAEKAREDIRDI